MINKEWTRVDSIMSMICLIIFIVYYLFFTASVAAGEAFDSAYGRINQDSVDYVEAWRKLGEWPYPNLHWVEPLDTSDYVVIPKQAGYVFEADTIRVTGRPILRIDTIPPTTSYGDIYIINHYLDHDRIDTIYVDTTRFYAKVDTVIWHVVLGVGRVRFGLAFDGDPSCWPVDTDLDTTWLPKVQVWLDSTKYRELMEILK